VIKSTGVAVDIDVFGGEGELKSVLRHILVRLIVEQGMGVFVPGYGLH
jgi:hypothetical protein